MIGARNAILGHNKLIHLLLLLNYIRTMEKIIIIITKICTVHFIYILHIKSQDDITWDKMA